MAIPPRVTTSSLSDEKKEHVMKSRKKGRWGAAFAFVLAFVLSMLSLGMATATAAACVQPSCDSVAIPSAGPGSSGWTYTLSAAADGTVTAAVRNDGTGQPVYIGTAKGNTAEVETPDPVSTDFVETYQVSPGQSITVTAVVNGESVRSGEHALTVTVPKASPTPTPTPTPTATCKHLAGNPVTGIKFTSLKSGDTVNWSQKFQLTVNFAIPNGTGCQGDTFQVPLPPELIGVPISNFAIKDSEGRGTIAYLTVKDGVATVTLTDFAERFENVTGWFSVWVQLNHDVVTEPGQDVTVNLSGGPVVLHTGTTGTGTFKTGKFCAATDGNNDTVRCTVSLKPGVVKQSADVRMIDTLPSELAYVAGSGRAFEGPDEPSLVRVRASRLVDASTARVVDLMVRGVSPGNGVRFVFMLKVVEPPLKPGVVNKATIKVNGREISVENVVKTFGADGGGNGNTPTPTPSVTPTSTPKPKPSASLAQPSGENPEGGGDIQSVSLMPILIIFLFMVGIFGVIVGSPSRKH